MESIELDYKFGHHVYRISVAVVIDATWAGRCTGRSS